MRVFEIFGFKSKKQRDLEKSQETAKNELLGLVIVATGSCAKDYKEKEKAKCLEMQKLWTGQIESNEVSCPFLRDALKEILELHFDHKFFPTIEDVYLWTHIEGLLKLNPFPFYTGDAVTQNKLRLLAERAAMQNGDIDAKNFKESVEKYRAFGKLLPFLKQLKSISEIGV
jgi:hypothetical protein